MKFTGFPIFPTALLVAAAVLPASALVTATRNGANLATRTYPGSASAIVPVTVTLAEEAGFTITATMDGAPLAMGSTVVRGTGYHEIHQTKRDNTTGASAASLAFQFIIASPGRGSTEMGLPLSEPWPLVNDAPSAFNGQQLDVIAPARYPLNLPVPVAVRLKKGASAGDAAGDPLFLHGVVKASNYPGRAVQLKRGWGSTILPAATTAGAKNFDGAVNGLTDSAPITYEETTTWIPKSGNLTATEAWPENSRIHLTTTITVKAGATLTVGLGTVIRAAPGVEIRVEPGASVAMNGTLSEPVVITPDSTAAPWGGVWLHQSTGAATVASFTATGTLFCCWGANQNWYTASGVTPSRSIFSRHRQQQPCFAIGNNAVCSLTDCSLIGPITAGEARGAGFATQAGTLSLNNTSLQRCITGGEQVSGSVEIHRSALFDFTEPNTDPDDGTAFDDADNDGIYLVPGNGRTYHLSKTFIGFTKDDGIDSGADGGGTTSCDGCWFENCTHEAFSNSGGNRIPETRNGVHFNNGQGMECGYGNGGNGPRSLVENCLMIGNLCGARYGDNYNSMGTYEGTITVKDSLLLYNTFRDTFAMEWRAASNWAYQDARLVLQNSRLTRADDLAHQQGAEDTPASAVWNPETDGSMLSRFMPVPDSVVGVALLEGGHGPTAMKPLTSYPGTGLFRVRLSTFSSRTVTVPWAVTGKTALNAPGETNAGSGILTFLPGETVKEFTAPLPELAHFDLVRVAIGNPTNALVTGHDVWFADLPGPETETVVAKAATGWDYYANRTPAASAQKPPDDATSHAWTAVAFTEDSIWKTGKTAPLGWGNLGAAAPYLALGTTLAAAEQGITTYFRKTFTLTDPASISSLRLNLLSDDGAVAFLNGVPFPPINVDPGTSPGGVSGIGSDKLAASTKGDGAGEITYDVLEAGSAILGALVNGANVLAIEVHQGGATSGDGVADASIEIVRQLPGADSSALSLFRINAQPFLTWDDTTGSLEQSEDLQNWIAVPDASNPFPLHFAEARRFYRLRH